MIVSEPAVVINSHLLASKFSPTRRACCFYCRHCGVFARQQLPKYEKSNSNRLLQATFVPLGFARSRRSGYEASATSNGPSGTPYSTPESEPRDEVPNFGRLGLASHHSTPGEKLGMRWHHCPTFEGLVVLRIESVFKIHVDEDFVVGRLVAHEPLRVVRRMVSQPRG